MSIEQEQHWITGEEIGRENRRLIEAGVPDDAPEFQELITRVAARDNYLLYRSDGVDVRQGPMAMRLWWRILRYGMPSIPLLCPLWMQRWIVTLPSFLGRQITATDGESSLNWRHVDPLGRTVLVDVLSNRPGVRAIVVTLNWVSGRPMGVKRLPVGPVIAWSPQGRWFVRHEAAERPEMVCRRVRDLSAAWHATPRSSAGAWSVDGKRFVIPVGKPASKEWNLSSIDLLGRKRTLLQNCSLIPIRGARFSGEPVIVCGTGGSTPQPLTLLRMNGQVAGQIGPPFPRGRYIIPGQLDRFAWQARHDGDCFLATKHRNRWRRQKLKIPQSPAATYSRLIESGESHLMLIQNTRPPTVWSVEWSGNVRRLRLPDGRPTQPLPFPWVDGRHLVRTVGNRLDLIDGHTGRIVRTVEVKLPSVIAQATTPGDGRDHHLGVHSPTLLR